MCGIAGIISINHHSDDLVNRIERMQASLQHRGPDDQGLFIAHDTAAVLAHTRLSIIDLTDNGHQPMSCHDERYTITFNGEIYNHKELRKGIEERGIKFRSHSDTEVILNLYKLDGGGCVKQLRGMFAFAIWDNQEKSLFVARDSLGIKPLYYWHDDNTLAFASELRALLKSDLSNKQLSAEGLYSYFRSGSVSEPNTLVDDISLLSAGHTLFWQNGKTELTPYWQIDFNSPSAESRDAPQQVHEQLLSSVKAHFVSDVPVGLFLSGGIDSTALLALSKEVHNAPINTYSIAFEEAQWNEGDIAKRVAQEFGANHTEQVITASIAKELFPQYLNAIDQPSIDGFNSFCVASVAQQHGEKVVLSGLGGDELFAGYKSFDVIPKMIRYGRYFSSVSPLLKKMKSPRLQRLADFLETPKSTAAAHSSLRGIFSDREAQALIKQRGLSLTDTSTEKEPTSNNIIDQVSELELSRYMRNQLLRDSDAMSMAWGLELRVPFVDQHLLDSVATIPASQRLQYGKKLLTDAVPALPEWVVNRPKQGFSFPFDEWFSDEWQDFNLDQAQNAKIDLSTWYRKWSLVVLDQWIEKHLT